MNLVWKVEGAWDEFDNCPVMQLISIQVVFISMMRKKKSKSLKMRF